MRLLSGFAAAAVVSCAAALPDANAASSSYDYVIVGGGTCGLVLANRLTENSAITVAVLEAGTAQNNNPNVTVPSNYQKAFNTDLDWQYKVNPRTYGGKSRTLELHAGKGLGGTSMINGMTYVRAQTAQIDAWETIGNTGWNWANLWPYYLKHEGFIAPTAAQSKAGATYNPQYHSTTGPVATGWGYKLVNGTIASVNNQTWQALGYKWNPDANGGNELGFTVWPQTVNRTSGLRADAAESYLYPVQAKRTNLHIFQGFGNKITWSANTSNGLPIASGVQYTAADGSSQTLLANKEVIVSTGALKTPAFLELSGIGNPKILTKYGIKTVVNSTGVGEHLQDQPNSALWYTSPNGTSTVSWTYVTYAGVKDIFGAQTSAYATNASNALSSYAQKASAASNGSISAASYLKLFQTQYDLLFNKGIPAAELLNSQFDNTVITALWNLITFSRGSVHIGSTTPATLPVIDLNYFDADLDLTVQTKIAEQTRTFWNTQPAKGLTTKETHPGTATVKTGATDAEWQAWLYGEFQPNYHTIGTCAMLPRAMGGVVDASLKVYGTSNVRVVDASIMPFQVSGHLTSTLYAVAERAADIIKGLV